MGMFARLGEAGATGLKRLFSPSRRQIDISQLPEGAAKTIRLRPGQEIEIRFNGQVHILALADNGRVAIGLPMGDSGDVNCYYFRNIYSNTDYRIERTAQYKFSLRKLPRERFIAGKPYVLERGDGRKIVISGKEYIIHRASSSNRYVVTVFGPDGRATSRSVGEMATEFLNNLKLELVRGNDGINETGLILTVVEDEFPTMISPPPGFEIKHVPLELDPKSKAGKRVIETLSGYLASENFADHLRERHPHRPGGRLLAGLQIDPETGSVIDLRRDDKANLLLVFNVGTRYLKAFTLEGDAIGLAACLSAVQEIWNLDKQPPEEAGPEPDPDQTILD